MKKNMQIWIMLSLAFSPIYAPAQTFRNQSGENQPIKPSLKDKCPVCGMFVAKYPDFLAEILFKDGNYVFFDGAKDMFRYYFNLEKYDPSKTTSEIDSIFVTDYYTLDLIDGKKAYYVVGSNIYGPMGEELIPHEKETDAKAYFEDHKGQSILRFSEITLDLIKSLK